jgi:hypothetical protein
LNRGSPGAIPEKSCAAARLPPCKEGADLREDVGGHTGGAGQPERVGDGCGSELARAMTAAMASGTGLWRGACCDQVRPG